MLLLPTDGTRDMGTGIWVRRRFLRSSRTSSCLSVILAGASERKAQWRNGKEPDLGEDDFEAPADEGARMTREKAVDLVMNAQQGVCRRAGCWWCSRDQVLEFRGKDGSS